MLFFAILLHYYVLYFGAVAVDSARCMFVLGWLVTRTFNRSSSHYKPFLVALVWELLCVTLPSI